MKQKKNKFPSSLPQLKKILPFFSYWKKAHHLQNLFQLENEAENFIEIELDLASIKEGKISIADLQIINEKIQLIQKNKDRRIKLEQEREDSIGIILHPLRFSVRGNKKVFYGIKIPALLRSNGELVPHSYLFPWIPRNLLEPAIDEYSPIIGEADEYENALRKSSFSLGTKFKDYFSQSELLFKKVTGYDFENFRLEDYQNLSLASLKLRNEEIQNNAVTKLYEIISKGKKDLGCLPSFCKTIKEKSYYKFSKAFLIKHSKNHVGHFTQDFPLSTSQRSSIYKLFDVENGGVFPIDGPPGTGKTTIIQSIIANSLVNSAINQAKHPALIVVCGATNQSVKNVIDSLDNHKMDNLLTNRWLPSLSSYGLFCAASTRTESGNSYHMQFRDGSGFYQEFLKKFQAKELSQYYLDKFQENFNKETFGKAVSLSKAISILNSKLRSINTTLHRELKSTLNIKFLDYIFGGFHGISQVEYEGQLNKLEYLDVKIRYLSFILATHYWEARFLQEIRQHSAIIESPKNYNHLNKDIWQWKSMITPTFVSTLSMAPKYFNDHSSFKPIIDTLIFDEAGQTLPEEGVIISCLAKKVVAIGDIKQLKPYALIPEPLDEIECKKAKLNKYLKKDFDELSKIGITSSKGSLMQLAKSIFPLRDTYGSGASLNEHRRSVPKIVEFCNELSYHGRLVPKRPNNSKSPYPPFSIIEITGNDQKIGISRKNEAEARGIASWIKENKELILKRYEIQNLAEILAVLTPFTAQAKILKQQLANQYPEMIIGTVNSLQGSERSIILFSSVYDQEEKIKYILDRDQTLLNVAVSRAKDSFIVFGNPKMLALGNDRPSNLLFKYTRSSEKEAT